MELVTHRSKKSEEAMTSNGKRPESSNGALRAGDMVLIVDAPSWCRRYVEGMLGYIARVFPFGEEPLVWVRFEPPIPSWCPRMETLEEFPFAAGQVRLLSRGNRPPFSGRNRPTASLTARGAARATPTVPGVAQK